MPTDAATLSSFEDLYDAAARTGGEVDYRLDAPRWQFLCHVADTKPVLMHGSTNPAIAEFEPRQPEDTSEFGNQNAVYAASDGLWPMYFAILDRQNHAMSTINTSVRIIDSQGDTSDPAYFFSISAPALAQRAFRRGTIYVLPRATFRQQPAHQFGPLCVVADHWASPVPVTPLFRIAVGPEDFPLLDGIRGHDDETTFARARANPDGFPWLPEADT